MICRAEAPYDWAALHALILRAFAGMKGRINPPSSARDLTPESLAATAQTSEIWAIGTPPQACMILTPKLGSLYLGKLAVDPALQGRGLGRSLVSWAEARARALGLPALTLQTRVELAENHATFQRLGFLETGRTSHEGFTAPTSITYTKTP
jgi:GNAT superfamily N-acetyltransferase